MANALLPYESQGWASIRVSSLDDVEFYAIAAVQLPQGDLFQHLSFSRGRIDDATDTGVKKGIGSHLFLRPPLTRRSELPECVGVKVYNHRFDRIYDKEYCPPETLPDRFTINEWFEASLAPLPEYPSTNNEKNDDYLGGCSLAMSKTPTQLSSPLLLLSISLLSLRRRRSTTNPVQSKQFFIELIHQP